MMRNEDDCPVFEQRPSETLVKQMSGCMRIDSGHDVIE
jgi:hypothetical protein